MYVPGTKIKKPFVRLAGEDGNAYSIMGRVTEALRRVGVPEEIVKEYYTKSRSGDYENLLRVAMEYSQEPSMSRKEEEDAMWEEEENEDLDDEE